jgi:hypothetical protein
LNGVHVNPLRRCDGNLTAVFAGHFCARNLRNRRQAGILASGSAPFSPAGREIPAIVAACAHGKKDAPAFPCKKKKDALRRDKKDEIAPGMP